MEQRQVRSSSYLVGNLERVYLYIMDVIRYDWKHILKNETSQKPLFKTFCCNNQGTMKIKRLLSTFQ